MFNTYRKIFDLLTPHERRNFTLLSILVIIMGLLDAVGVAGILPFLAIVAAPELTETNQTFATIYRLSGAPDQDAFLRIVGIGVFSVFIISVLFKIVTLYALARFGHMRKFSLSSRLLEGYLHQPYVWFLSRHSADLGKVVLHEVETVVNGTIIPAFQIMANTVSLLFLVGLLIVIEPKIAVIAISVLGGTYLIIFLFVRKRLTLIGRQRAIANRDRYMIAQETMGSMKDVKLLGLESSFLKRFRGPARRYAQAATASQIIGELPRHLLEGISFGGILLLVLTMLLNGQGTLVDILPTLGLFAFAGLRMFPALQTVYRSMTALRFGAPTLKVLHDDMQEVRGGVQTALTFPVTKAPMRMKSEIDLFDIRYAFPDSEQSVVRGLNMTIEANTTVGIVGGTGAGKTTTIDIIMGLLQADSGELRVDGNLITPENLRSWQLSIGYVPQQIFLMDGSISANIAFGIPPEERARAQIERAARLAELHEFAMETPQGYDTLVGERGVRLSGGQRQRIAIARTLYHDPDVLVLDEATSALDNLTERAVMQAVTNLGHAKTIIMIAHRLSTVEKCDKIFLLENGCVADSGTYDELKKSNEAFRSMAEAP